jgi:hypothetical protein
MHSWRSNPEDACQEQAYRSVKFQSEQFEDNIFVWKVALL